MNASRATENFTIHFKVKDYGTWRRAYDEQEDARRAAGITNGRVFCNAEDPNDVVIVQDVADEKRARSWLGSDDMRGTIQRNEVGGSGAATSQCWGWVRFQ